METITLEVLTEHAGDRIDSYICRQLPSLSRTAAQRLCDEGMVLVGDRPIKKNFRVETGQVLEIRLPEIKAFDVVAQEIPLDIVFEDDDLLVINKPKGMVVHPAPGNEEGTLVNALLHHCGDGLSGIGGVMRPGIVHRLDKDTSGLIVAAKTDFAHQGLSAQMAERKVARRYFSVVHGTLKNDSGRIDAPIGRSQNDRKKMAVTDKNSRQAATRYEVLERYNGFTYVKCVLETGRTHQIRVHMAYIGHPVAGDTVYGPKKVEQRLEGQCLHAGELAFTHPRTEQLLAFKSLLPEYFTDFLAYLKKITF